MQNVTFFALKQIGDVLLVTGSERFQEDCVCVGIILHQPADEADVHLRIPLLGLDPLSISVLKHVPCEKLEEQEPLWIDRALEDIVVLVQQTLVAQRQLPITVICKGRTGDFTLLRYNMITITALTTVLLYDMRPRR